MDWDIGPGDLVFLECPHNSTCLVPDLRAFVEKAHEKDAIVVVDSTFATPIGVQPLKYGVDMVMHSCTKFLGGHSDLLGGVITCRERLHYFRLRELRQSMGNLMGSLESFLLLRSLRTLYVRVNRQSETSWEVAQWLSAHPSVDQVFHPFLESHPTHLIAKETLKIGPACFLVQLKRAADAWSVPDRTKVFTAATSLGSVESLIEKKGDYSIRLSIGLEDPQDLIQDLDQALNSSKDSSDDASAPIAESPVAKKHDKNHCHLQ